MNVIPRLTGTTLRITTDFFLRVQAALVRETIAQPLPIFHRISYILESWLLNILA